MLEDSALLEQVESAIVTKLETSSNGYDAAAMIDELRDHGYSDSIVRAALWYLIDRMTIRLTPTLDLSLAERSQPAAVR